MELVDSHAHLDFAQFAHDREAMLERARVAGVSAMLAIGAGPGREKMDAPPPYADQYDWMYASVGVLAHEANHSAPQHVEELTRLPKLPKVIARGEIGLD